MAIKFKFFSFNIFRSSLSTRYQTEKKLSQLSEKKKKEKKTIIIKIMGAQLRTPPSTPQYHSGFYLQRVSGGSLQLDLLNVERRWSL